MQMKRKNVTIMSHLILCVGGSADEVRAKKNLHLDKLVRVDGSLKLVRCFFAFLKLSL